jgi:hypothetical protein
MEVAANPAGDGKLIVSAVAASSGPITIATEDQLTFQGSAIRTSGDLVVDAGGSVLSLPATVTTGNGDVSLRGPVLTAGNVAAGGSRATNLVADLRQASCFITAICPARSLPDSGRGSDLSPKRTT